MHRLYPRITPQSHLGAAKLLCYHEQQFLRSRALPGISIYLKLRNIFCINFIYFVVTFYLWQTTTGFLLRAGFVSFKNTLRARAVAQQNSACLGSTRPWV